MKKSTAEEDEEEEWKKGEMRMKLCFLLRRLPHQLVTKKEH